MTITILLGIIALSELLRLFLTHRGVSKKAHFKNKLAGTEKLRFDMEFKLFKTQEVREEIREERDFMLSRIDTLKKSIENFPKSKDKEEKARLKDQLELAERDESRLTKQLASLDTEINGSKPTNELPNGHTGIKQQIESIRELESMLKAWIKSV